MESYYPVSVKTLPDYRLLLRFDNGEERLFDVAPYLATPFFASLKNQAVFQSARINPLTVEWNGDIDICPDELYYNSVPYQRENHGGAA
ncbi:MAG: DUF2442 domain-containing protein [Oscillospiraceae bacterium]|nr:DUF2442 domain-containing protein [Oscillospiraceae bacterium]